MIGGKGEIAVSEEIIMSKIYFIRGNKVMIDRDLAELYGVETKVLKQTVRRNKDRFPSDFMFEMSAEELQNWRSQFVTSISDKMGLRYPPFCFTEHGVLMLASVLYSKRAIQINIQIVRVFIKMREILMEHKEILQQLENIQNDLAKHDEKIILIFEYINRLEEEKQLVTDRQNRKKVGFKQPND
jgi:phage regulator Rha-like protein